jgi:hypothetical protein
MPKEELDAVVGDGEGAGGDESFVLEMEKVLAQFFFANVVRGPIVVLGKLAHHAHIGDLGVLGQAAQLQVLDHALA